MTAVGELAAIHAFWARAQATGQRCALATVVSVQGSSYRLPGARMLTCEDHTWVGTVSGGCLESDVDERSLQALRDGRPACVVYDTSDDSDIVFGLGMGCRGRIHVLIEPLDQDGGPLPFLEGQVQRRQPAVLATVFAVRAKGSDLSVGQHFYFAQMPAAGDCGLDLLSEAAATFAQRRSRIAAAKDPSGGDDTLILWEYLQPPPALLICGAGHDALPLVQLAKALAWRVEVLDARPAYLTSERFPSVDALHAWSQWPEVPGWSPAAGGIDAALLMTHNFERDRVLLAWLIAARVPYIGLLGPKRRGDELLATLPAQDEPDLAAQGGADWRQRIFSPVGLDIGAWSPAEIALAIVAEVQMHLTGSRGNSLRQRSGPIHQDRPRVVPALAAARQPGQPSAGLGVVVLAAGASSRMGRPKQTLLWQGATLLEHTLRLAMQVASPARVALVLGAGAAAVRPADTDRPGPIVCINTGWASGMQSSIRCGLAALPRAELSGVLILLADQPLVTAKHIENMASAFTAAPEALIVAAAYADAVGAPAIFRASLFAELLTEAAADTAAGAKHLLKKYAERVVTVPLPEAVLDVDTPEDYQRLLATSGALDPPAGPS